MKKFIIRFTERRENEYEKIMEGESYEDVSDKFDELSEKECFENAKLINSEFVDIDGFMVYSENGENYAKGYGDINV